MVSGLELSQPGPNLRVERSDFHSKNRGVFFRRLGGGCQQEEKLEVSTAQV